MIKTVSLLFVLQVLLLTGCTYNFSKDKKPAPTGLIARDSMVDILTDLHLYEAIIVQKKKKSRGKLDEFKNKLYAEIMMKYKITRDRFESSLEYYQQDKDVFDGIYEDVITKLSKMKAEAAAETARKSKNKK